MDTVTVNTKGNVGSHAVIPIEDIAKLKRKGLSHSQIGKILGCDKSNVTRRLQRAGIDFEAVDDYKGLRADILASGQRKIVNAITDDDIKNASLLQKVTAVGILQDKELQILGKSGNDTADSISAMVELVDKVIKAVKPSPVASDEAIDITPDSPADDQ